MVQNETQTVSFFYTTFAEVNNYYHIDIRKQNTEKEVNLFIASGCL
jgi:hypothetical protein